MIVCNGELLVQASQFSLNDVEVITATVDLDTVTTYRTSVMSRSAQAADALPYHHIQHELEISKSYGVVTPPMLKARIHSPQEEIALGPACYLWDYLRRTGLSGFFLPLSGGIDSSSTACVVASMCRLVHEACHAGNAQVLADVRRITKQPDDYVPSSPQVGSFHSILPVSLPCNSTVFDTFSLIDTPDSPPTRTPSHTTCHTTTHHGRSWRDTYSTRHISGHEIRATQPEGGQRG